MKPETALLILGSPRGSKSVSRLLAARLAAGLDASGLSIQTHDLYSALESEEHLETLLAAAGDVDLLLFAFPLYVDHLPAPLIGFMERLARRPRPVTDRVRWIAVLVQCGFPETHQAMPAVAIMRRFAELNGFRWAGGLSMGMGGAINGRRLPEKPSGMLRNTLLALDQATEALAEGGPIPEEALTRMGKKLMPFWLYFTAANWGWRREARRHAKKKGGRIDLYAKPYR